MLSQSIKTHTFTTRTAPVRPDRSSIKVRAEGVINPGIDKGNPKVVNTVVVPTDLDGKPMVAYCRCWRSGTFPKCDGKHVAHNKDTGDNVGPLLVKNAE